jgi:hypothetical protein
LAVGAAAGLSLPAAACELAKVADMPLFAVGDHFAVTGLISGAPRLFIVDTGASATLIRDAVVHELAIPVDGNDANATRVNGLGAIGPLIENVVPGELSFGGLSYRGRSVAVGRMAALGDSQQQIAGLLGDDVLSQFDVEFDFPARRLTFYRVRNCAGPFAPWRERYVAGVFRRFNSEVVVDGAIAGRRVDVVVDTGAPVSFVSRRAALALGVEEAQFGVTHRFVFSPLNGGAMMPVREAAFAGVSIAGEAPSDRSLGVVDVDIPGGQLLLGLDFWRERKLWLSYTTGQVFIGQP